MAYHVSTKHRWPLGARAAWVDWLLLGQLLDWIPGWLLGPSRHLRLAGRVLAGATAAASARWYDRPGLQERAGRRAWRMLRVLPFFPSRIALWPMRRAASLRSARSRAAARAAVDAARERSLPPVLRPSESGNVVQLRVDRHRGIQRTGSFEVPPWLRQSASPYRAAPPRPGRRPLRPPVSPPPPRKISE